ncbi:ATP-binding cassette domain-containing protein [Motilimonas eburnea]|uniref:ATP-binding cassette domain-containing protein n=1 Tax=Motilimonas eburnea TaxID=1737488 RepID=UPI001E5A220C|nr:ATP-binding cassette domain-containing protein [Motilimonas eburnea]MCE2570130.1 ATP-binding cassette domain-containing protein [Motilimonas eburnea]
MIVLSVNKLSKSYVQHHGLFSRKHITAFSSVSFELEQGKTLAIIGESGSGKSSLAKALTGVIAPSSGSICIDGVNIANKDHQQRCRQIRMIFQDPSTSLNPRSQVGRILRSPLLLNTELSEQEMDERVSDALRLVGLLPEHAQFYPRMLSGGQKQRVALARALILKPKIIVADEVLATLDVSVRSQIINLILDVQRQQKISFIMVAHNLGIVRHISDNIIVMHEGQIVEAGETAAVLDDPQHTITQRLLMNQQVKFRK